MVELPISRFGVELDPSSATDSSAPDCSLHFSTDPVHKEITRLIANIFDTVEDKPAPHIGPMMAIPDPTGELLSDFKKSQQRSATKQACKLRVLNKFIQNTEMFRKIAGSMDNVVANWNKDGDKPSVSELMSTEIMLEALHEFGSSTSSSSTSIPHASSPSSTGSAKNRAYSTPAFPQVIALTKPILGPVPEAETTNKGVWNDDSDDDNNSPIGGIDGDILFNLRKFAWPQFNAECSSVFDVTDLVWLWSPSGIANLVDETFKEWLRMYKYTPDPPFSGSLLVQDHVDIIRWKGQNFTEWVSLGYFEIYFPGDNDYRMEGYEKHCTIGWRSNTDPKSPMQVDSVTAEVTEGDSSAISSLPQVAPPVKSAGRPAPKVPKLQQSPDDTLPARAHSEPAHPSTTSQEASTDSPLGLLINRTKELRQCEGGISAANKSQLVKALMASPGFEELASALHPQIAKAKCHEEHPTISIAASKLLVFRWRHS